MIMQRSTFTGSPIALHGHDRFADRMRRITDGLLDEGALVTTNCRNQRRKSALVCSPCLDRS